MRPTQIIQEGDFILSLFIDNIDNDGKEEYVWYRGQITKIFEYGDDYLECNIEYDDGEIEENALLYDTDFNDEEKENAWKFENNQISSLCSKIQDIDLKIKEIQNYINNYKSIQCLNNKSIIPVESWVMFGFVLFYMVCKDLHSFYKV